MAITIEEVKQLAMGFLQAASSGGSAAEQASFFCYPSSRIVAPDGSVLDMDAHYKMHQNFTNEKFVIDNVQVVPICDKPERARVNTTVYWEATYKTQPELTIRTVVGQYWIVERQADGKIKFVIYHATYFHPIPGSAPIEFPRELNK